MEEIQTDDEPAPLGPYSQANRDGDTLDVSGQGPFDPESGDVVPGGIEAQTERTLENLSVILEAGGSSFEEVLKVTVYASDMDVYGAINTVYERYMSQPYPARAVVGVGELPVELDIEIECVAQIN